MLANLLDRCIVLPGGYRVGIDPILGLLPGIGDFLASLLSCYLIFEAALLGIQKRFLVRMAANVLIETLVGTIPVLGDIFDAVWKANVKNLQLVEVSYQPNLKARSKTKVFLATVGLLILLWGIIIMLGVLLLQGLVSMFSK